jgi:hypothetical protein
VKQRGMCNRVVKREKRVEQRGVFNRVTQREEGVEQRGLCFWVVQRRGEGGVDRNVLQGSAVEGWNMQREGGP